MFVHIVNTRRAQGIFWPFWLYELQIFKFLYFLNVFFLRFLDKPIGKKLSNFKVIYSVCNTEEIPSFYFCFINSKTYFFDVFNILSNREPAA